MIYCREYGIDIYARDASDTYQFALRVLTDAYEALGTPAANTLLGTSADGNVRLFLLTTGEFQVNAYFGNEEYVAIWTGCPGIGLDISVYDRATGELLAKGNFPAEAPGAPTIPPLAPGEFGEVAKKSRSNPQGIDLLSEATPYAAPLFDSPPYGGRSDDQPIFTIPLEHYIKN